VNNVWREKVKFRVNRDLYPWESKTILLPWKGKKNQIEMHYIDAGPRDGPILLMFHGNPTWSFLYHKMIKALEHKFRCIAVDYPGFGLSLEPRAELGYDYTPEHHALVLSSFVEALDLRDITPIVQDWGGPIGLSVARRHPDRIKALVIGSTWAWPMAHRFSYMMPFFSLLVGNPLMTFLCQTFNVMLRFFTSMFLSITKDELEMYNAPWDTRNVERWSRGKTSLFARYILYEGFLTELKDDLLKDSKLRNVPVLFFYGEKDIAFGLGEMEEFQANFFTHRDSKIVHFPNAGHFWQQDVGEKAAKVVEEWYDDATQ